MILNLYFHFSNINHLLYYIHCLTSFRFGCYYKIIALNSQQPTREGGDCHFLSSNIVN